MMIDSAADIRGCHQEGIYDLLEILAALLEKYGAENTSFAYMGVKVTCGSSDKRGRGPLLMWATKFFARAFFGKEKPTCSWRFFLGLVEYRHLFAVPYTVAANEVMGLVAFAFPEEFKCPEDVLVMIERQLGSLRDESYAVELRRWLINRREVPEIPEFLR